MESMPTMSLVLVLYVVHSRLPVLSMLCEVMGGVMWGLIIEFFLWVADVGGHDEAT